MCNKSHAERGLRGPFNGDDVHIGWDAITKVLEFFAAFYSALATRTAFHFRQENQRLSEGGLRPRKRVRAIHVLQGISDVLGNPDRYLPGWRSRGDPPLGG